VNAADDGSLLPFVVVVEVVLCLCVGLKSYNGFHVSVIRRCLRCWNSNVHQRHSKDSSLPKYVASVLKATVYSKLLTIVLTVLYFSW